MHTTFELWQAALQDPILAPVKQGVFPRDKLHIVNKYPSGLIANTDPRDQSGTHWVAMYFISPWESEFFDSYGVSSRYLWHEWIHRERCYALQQQTVPGTYFRHLWRLLFILFISLSTQC